MHSTNELSEKEFRCFADLVYKKAGINLHDGKRELVRARLGKRLRGTQFRSFKEYYQYLTEQDQGDELIRMLDVISTNLTSFFREPKHFEFLEEKVLVDLKKKANGAAPSLRIWSAGCSSGEEPYTLAMVVRRFFQNTLNFQYSILATDISTQVLSSAMAGVYHESRLRNMPPDTLRRFFQKGRGKWEGHYRAKAELRNHIEFRRFNLMDQFPFKEKFDVIFCRNVMIYFDKPTQQSLVKKYYDCLVKGGYFFIGHSESLMSIDHSFKYVQPSVYLKS